MFPAQNLIADELSNLAAKRKPVPPGTFVEYLTQPSVKPKPAAGTPSTSTQGAPTSSSRGGVLEQPRREPIPRKHAIMFVEGTTPPWAEDILQYLRDHTLPEDDKQAERVTRQA
ncbi:uncharacterized protein [Lolium perenne]|jgi:hypothetical protein|uniref:uncharacterized protein n=1 Tax=Lolium perenne TaxID=4522 RepID=UPI003A993FA6